MSCHYLACKIKSNEVLMNECCEWAHGRDVMMRDAVMNRGNAHETNLLNDLLYLSDYLGHSLACLRDNRARKGEMWWS